MVEGRIHCVSLRPSKFLCPETRDCLASLHCTGLASGPNRIHLPFYFLLLLSTYPVSSTSISPLTIMNWTGGRLRRHSSNTKTAAHTKIQKQNFAKSRVRPSKDIYHQLPFQNFTRFGHLSKGEFSQDQGTNELDGEATHISTQQVRNMRLILTLYFTNEYQVWTCIYKQSATLFTFQYATPLTRAQPLRLY